MKIRTGFRGNRRENGFFMSFFCNIIHKKLRKPPLLKYIQTLFYMLKYFTRPAFLICAWRDRGGRMEKRFKTMKERPATERPYEKCLEYGPESLSDGELLAVILRSGTRECSCPGTGVENSRKTSGLQRYCRDCII